MKRKRLSKRILKALCEESYRVFMCAEHGTNLASESLATGIYRQV